MEQHPIPQDITGFKFKLVGDMTLQQFGYLAVGAILAYLSFAAKLPFIIKYPLAFLFGFSGFALAFLPVEERPLDRWLISFVKAVYSPTQYIWEKSPNLPSFFKTTYSPFAGNVPGDKTILTSYSGAKMTLEEYLKKLPKTSHFALDNYENAYLAQVGQLMAGQAGKPPLIPFKPPLTSQSEMNKKLEERIEKKLSEEKTVPEKPFGSFAIVDGKIVKNIPKEKPTVPFVAKQQVSPLTSSQGKVLEKKEMDIKEEIDRIKNTNVFTVEDLDKLKALAQKLSEIQGQKEKAEGEVVRLKQELSKEEKSSVRPTAAVQDKKQEDRVKFVAQKQAKRAGMPNPPQTPNIVSGLVIDQKEEILPGVIIVIKDNQDNPVRAIKSNKLGQFSISTPLANSIYHLELEKENYQFDIIEIEAKGQVIMPLAIKAK